MSPSGQKLAREPLTPCTQNPQTWESTPYGSRTFAFYDKEGNIIQLWEEGDLNAYIELIKSPESLEGVDASGFDLSGTVGV